MVAIALLLIVFSSVPFWFAWMEYPKTTPTMRSVSSIPLVVATDRSSVETFAIPVPLVGAPALNTITYRAQGASITAQTPLNVSVKVNIDRRYLFALHLFIWIENVTIDNSLLSNGIADPLLPLSLVRNDSSGLGYSIEVPMILTEPGPLTGTVGVSMIPRRASTVRLSTTSFEVRNVTSIQVQSFEDLQLENETNFVENANLQNNAQIQYNSAETLYDDGVVTTLTLVIVGFMMVDIGVSLYDVSEKKNQAKECGTRGTKNSADNEETPAYLKIT